MIYSFTLAQVAVGLGLGSFLVHGWWLLNYDQAVAGWRRFPRSEPMGGILLALATAWAAWLAGTMNLMEYTRFRPLFVLAAVGLGVTSWLYVREFIAVRALGVLLLLGANVLLDACFLREDALRLIVVAYAYVLIVKGMIMVGPRICCGMRSAGPWPILSAGNCSCFSGWFLPWSCWAWGFSPTNISDC